MPPAIPAESRPHLRSSSVGPASKASSRFSIRRRCASIAELLASCCPLATPLLHCTAKGFRCKALFPPNVGKVDSERSGYLIGSGLMFPEGREHSGLCQHTWHLRV